MEKAEEYKAREYPVLCPFKSGNCRECTNLCALWDKDGERCAFKGIMDALEYMAFQGGER